MRMNNLEISKRRFINGGSGERLLQGEEGERRKEQREHPKVSTS